MKRVVDIGGTVKYLLNGNPHREDGPAVEYPNGSKEWYIKGKIHREDGPALEYINGNKYYKYWYTNDAEAKKITFK